MENLKNEELLKINGGSFWGDAGEWIGNHTAQHQFNDVMETYCKNKWNISYKEYRKLTGWN